MRKWLSEKRKEKGYTQTQLSEKTGITQQVISQYEKGGKTPNLRNSVKLSELLEFDIKKLLEL